MAIQQTIPQPTGIYEGHENIMLSGTAGAVFSGACLGGNGFALVTNTGATNNLEWSPDGVAWGIIVPAGAGPVALPYNGSPKWKSASGTTAYVLGCESSGNATSLTANT